MLQFPSGTLDEIKYFQWHLKAREFVSGRGAVLPDLFYSPIAAGRKSFGENIFAFVFLRLASGQAVRGVAGGVSLTPRLL